MKTHPNAGEYEAIVFHDSNCLTPEADTYESVQQFIDVRINDDLSRYHIFIRKDGALTVGETLDSETFYDSRIGEFDGRLISVFVIGDFSKKGMTGDQAMSLFELVDRLFERFEVNWSNFVSHEMLVKGETECPGDHFPIKKIRKHIKGRQEDALGGFDREEVRKMIGTDSLQDTCDAIKSINGRLKSHAEAFDEVDNAMARLGG